MRPGTHTTTAIRSPARPNPARSGAGVTWTRSPSPSRELAAAAPVRGLGADEDHAPPVVANRRQGEAGVGPAEEPLVARDAPPRRERGDDAARAARLRDPL